MVVTNTRNRLLNKNLYKTLKYDISMPKTKIKKQKITKNMTISSVIDKYPQTANVFMSHGMYCFGCSVAADETLEQGATAHPGIKLNKLMQDLNRAADKKLDEVEKKISDAGEKIEIKQEPKKSFFKKLFGRK